MTWSARDEAAYQAARKRRRPVRSITIRSHTRYLYRNTPDLQLLTARRNLSLLVARCTRLRRRIRTLE